MEFKGMALYNVDEIRSALEEYRTYINEVKAIIRGKIVQAELDWKPTWWQKLWGVKTLKKVYIRQTFHWGYEYFLIQYKFITFNEEEEALLEIVGAIGYMDFPLWSSEYNQIKNLFNGGKECYLNPNQAAFVNKFKKELNNVN